MTRDPTPPPQAAIVELEALHVRISGMPQDYGRATQCLKSLPEGPAKRPSSSRPAAPAGATSAQTQLALLLSNRTGQRVALTEADYEAAATALEVEVDAIKAVAVAETKDAPFDSLGRPTILFERHVFHRLTHGAHDRSHPGLSNELMGGYGLESTQYSRLQDAAGLNQEAALMSASWGRFQLMGENYREAGFTSVNQFVMAMNDSERKQIDALVSFIRSDRRRHTALRDKDWPTFARYFNGRNYRRNNYDVKMQNAYDALIKERAEAAEQ